MQKLSKREKVLLYLLALIAVLAGGIYFAIIPTMDYYSQIQEDITEKRLEKHTMEHAIASIPSLEITISDALTKLEEISGRFFPIMNNEQIDEIVTNKLLEFSLSPKRISIDDIEKAVLSGYAAVPRYQAEAYMNTVSVEASGMQIDIVKFIDSMTRELSMKVRDYSISQTETSDGGSFVATIEIYMY